MSQNAPGNPLFEGFQPQPIGGATAGDVPVKENPGTGEITPAKTPRKRTTKPRKAAKPAKTAKPPAKPRAAKPVTSTPAAPQFNLAIVFAAMRELKESDHAVFEKLLADNAMRGRIVAALSKLFP